MAPTDYGPNNPPKSHELYAGAKYIGDKCFDPNLVFFKCKDAHEHPKKCLEEGKAVHACVHTALQDLQKRAPKEFASYASCLKLHNLKMDECRSKQLLFETAVFGK
jgi:NADH dehydrogenase (ubiquinone) 1 alpha subcomplex subunit 8